MSMIRNPMVILLIAKDQNDVIAQATLEYSKEDVSKTAHVGVLGIVVHPSYQNLGLGTQMFLVLEDIAKEVGLLKLEIACIEKNQRALHVYEKKLNYFREGCRRKNIKLKDGTFSDLILLGKFLAPL